MSRGAKEIVNYICYICRNNKGVLASKQRNIFYIALNSSQPVFQGWINERHLGTSYYFIME